MKKLLQLLIVKFFTVSVLAGIISLPGTISLIVELVIADLQTVNTVVDSADIIIKLSASGGIAPYIFTLKTGPSHGNISAFDQTTGFLTYTPDNSYVGVDACTFTVTDSLGISSLPGTVSICIKDTAPTVYSQTIENIIVDSLENIIILTGIDLGEEELTFTVPQISEHGGKIVQASPGSATIVYSPAHGFIGQDSFSFTATNTSNQTSLPATVMITVLDTTPIAYSRGIRTISNIPISVTLSGLDLGNEPLTFALETLPLHGTIVGLPATSSDGSIIVMYTPDTNYVGLDSFDFTVINTSLFVSLAATIEIVSIALPVSSAQNTSLLHIVSKYAGC